jgi:hypothetical protein
MLRSMNIKAIWRFHRLPITKMIEKCLIKVKCKTKREFSASWQKVGLLT